MLTPYPSTFPQDALLVMLDKVRGKPVGAPELVHSAWNVTGYALSQTMGGGQIVAGEIEAVSKLNDEELILAVLRQNGVVAADDNSNVSFTFVPWVMVAKLAVKILVGVLV